MNWWLHGLENGNIRSFFRHHHPECTGDIEGDKQEDKAHDGKGHPFFNIHNTEEGFFLTDPILDHEVRAGDGLYTFDSLFGVDIRLDGNFQCAQCSPSTGNGLNEGEIGQDILHVDLRLNRKDPGGGQETPQKSAEQSRGVSVCTRHAPPV